MNKKNTPSPQNVMYVKLSPYYGSYLKTKYGNPVLFPNIVMAKQQIDRYLIHNPTLRCITPFSVSSAAFNYKDKNQPFTINAYMPDKEERDQFVAIVIPQEVMRFNRVIETSNYWQLSNYGAVEFRDEIKTAFWIAFSTFYDDCRFRARRIDRIVTVEEVISDFMVMYNIDMSMYDNMKLYRKRLLPNLLDKVEERRDALELKTGNVLIYTD